MDRFRHRGPTVVNICFHGIGTPDRPLEPGEDEYWISADSYHSILDAVVGDERVRLSFDDGNASDVEIGLPGLVARDLTATFFALAGRLDADGSLTTDGVRRLVAAGMGIGTHGMDHLPWRGLPPDVMGRELVAARHELERAAGSPVDDAALPRGQYDRRVLGELRRHGYRSVHTSDRRWAREGDWLQPRFSVRRTDTAATVRERMLTRAPLLERAERAAVCVIKRYR